MASTFVKAVDLFFHPDILPVKVSAVLWSSVIL